MQPDLGNTVFNMLEHKFGGDWTEQKLQVLHKYLRAFIKVMHGQKAAGYYKTIYVDAFAGTGYRTEPKTKASPAYGEATFFDELMDEALGAPEAQEFREGSVTIALDLEPAFDRYTFIESKAEHVSELHKLKLKYINDPRVMDIRHGDANIELVRLCHEVDWGPWRGVVFLDPYGMSVDWSTIEALSRARIDLWLLFPLAQAVNRVLTSQAPPPPAWSSRLDRFFGTHDWFEVFYRSRDEVEKEKGQPSMLDLLQDDGFLDLHDSKVKVADFASIEKFFMRRLATLFEAVPAPLILRNSQNTPLYLLCFASHNEGPALSIARDLLKP